MISQKAERSAKTKNRKSKEKTFTVTIEGSGKSLKDPIVIKGVPTRRKFDAFENHILEERFGRKYKLLNQKYMKHKGRAIHRMTIRTAKGKKQVVFFDLTDLISRLKKEAKKNKVRVER
ncbi:hypothetical protein ACFL2Q_15625 [Thermodesulfobacteriota bacterium]